MPTPDPGAACRRPAPQPSRVARGALLVGMCLAASLGGPAGAATFGNSNTGSSAITVEGLQRGLANQSPSVDGVAESIYVYLDFADLGGEQSSAVRCAIYSWDGFGENSYLKDTTEIRILPSSSSDGWYGFRCLLGAALSADSAYCLQVMAGAMSVDVLGGRRQSSSGDSPSYISGDAAWSDPETFSLTVHYTFSIYCVYSETGSLATGRRRRLVVGDPAGGG